MAMSFMSTIMMMVAGGLIAGDDLLSFVHTQTYWKQKNVEMTIAAMSAEIKTDSKAAANPQAAAVRRLMAIRTLGELKKTEAVEVLLPLLMSKDMFVADYAQRAIAVITSKTYTQARSTKAAREMDMGLLPSSCGAVGQITLVFDQKQDIDKMLEGAALPDGMSKEQALSQMTQMVLSVAEKIGNVRLDDITVGVARELGGRAGYVVLIGRGLYDAKATADALAPIVKETSDIGGVKVFRPNGDTAIILPDNNCIIIMAGPKKEVLPVTEVVSAMKVGKTGLQNTPEMAKLVKSVDTTSDLWVAMEISEAFRQAPPLAPLKWLTATGKHVKGAMNFTLLAEAKDAKSLIEALAIVENGRQEGIREINKEIERGRPRASMLKPILELLKSVKTVQTDKKVTLTATLKGSSAMSTLMPMMMGVSRRTDAPRPQPAPEGF